MRPEVTVNLAAVNKRLLRSRDQQSEDLKGKLLGGRRPHHHGDGRLDGTNRLVVSTGTGKKRTDFDSVEADTLVISVGASPRILPTAKPDGERILTWTQLYTLEDMPEHLIVVGSGVTGAEFASAYLALGAAVTLVSSREQVLPNEDADAARRDRQGLHPQRHDRALEERGPSRSSARRTACSSRSRTDARSRARTA